MAGDAWRNGPLAIASRRSIAGDHLCGVDGTNPKQLSADLRIFAGARRRRWLRGALKRIEAPEHEHGIPVVLPPKMAEAFNIGPGAVQLSQSRRSGECRKPRP